MAVEDFVVVTLLLSCLAATSHGVAFSSLAHTLTVSASTKQGQEESSGSQILAVLRAGEDNITVIWSVNASLPAGTDSAYRTVKVKLCYAPVSQKDRGWRKTVDDLEKDKTCQHKIVAKPYSPSGNVFTWKVLRDVPTATYFIRAYAHNAGDQEVAYGQTTDPRRTTNMFDVDAISGRHATLEIASVCFSAFSVVSLFGFFFLEKRKSRSLQQ